AVVWPEGREFGSWRSLLHLYRVEVGVAQTDPEPHRSSPQRAEIRSAFPGEDVLERVAGERKRVPCAETGHHVEHRVEHLDGNRPAPGGGVHDEPLRLPEDEGTRNHETLIGAGVQRDEAVAPELGEADGAHAAAAVDQLAERLERLEGMQRSG